MKQNTVVVAAWPGYFPESVQRAFEDETGYVIHFVSLPADEDLLGWFEGREWENAGESDRFKPHLIMPSAFVAQALKKGGHIQDFNRELLSDGVLPLTSARQYNPDFDPDNEFVIPYAWGATGIAYDSDRLNGLPESWAALFGGDPLEDEVEDNLNFDRISQIALLDDARFTLGSVLLFQGKSPNTDNPEDVRQAANFLIELSRKHRERPGNKDYFEITYEESNMPTLLREEKIGLSMTWSADVTTATREETESDSGKKSDQLSSGNLGIRLALPNEGSIVFRDSFVISSGLTPVENQGVHALVDFMLRPEIAAEVTNSSFFANTIIEANPYVDRFIFNGPSYFIHPSRKNKFLSELAPKMREVYQIAWAHVQYDVFWGDNSVKAANKEIEDHFTGGN
ncbi:extracellular solute-binding protein [Opitutaceae bacterium]|nr:extracellular solute-binding protein [Opitutaceae bacterium]